MKKYLLVAALAITLSNYAAGQNYFPFPTTYGFWFYRLYDQFHNPTSQTTYFLLSGDTVIGAHTYKKLSGGSAIGGVYGNCLREENKIIYYYHPDSAAEYVLYDFNLQVGDTLFNPYDCCWFPQHDTIIIAQIDSQLFADNQYHKIWFADNCIEWIEGIGSNLLLSPYGECSLSAGYWLDCFTGDSGLVYGDASCLVGINEMGENLSASIYPNPFTTQLNITLANNESSHIILYDILSRKLLQQSFINSVSLNTSQLSKGIYFYEMRNKNGVLRNGKVVKE